MAAVILISVFAVFKVYPIDYSLYNNKGISYLKARVVSVNSDSTLESENLPGRKIGTQNITVKFTEGELKDREVDIDNILSDTHSVEVKPGTRVMVKCDMPEGVEPYFTIYQYDRTVGILITALIFLALVFVIARVKGLLAALSLGISLSVIVLAFIPAVYNGVSPVLASFAVCIVITVSSLSLLNGFSGKTLVAIISTVTGLLLSIAAYMLIKAVLHLTGYSIEESETLIMISRTTGLKISEVLFSGILLASLGAVMDTAMSIASALHEVAVTSEGKANLFKSGLAIGGDMIGTMCQTLVLAFAGSSIASLLVVVSYGTSLNQFLSSDFFAVEILQSAIGSVAIILTVPVTAFLCSRFFKSGNKR